MSGNQEANKRTAERNKIADPDYYVKLGAKGGKASSNRPLRGNSARAREIANIRWAKAKKMLDS